MRSCAGAGLVNHGSVLDVHAKTLKDVAAA
jgi:hypothetical protein